MIWDNVKKTLNLNNMKSLIENWNLQINKGPLRVSFENDFSLDEMVTKKPFHIHSNAFPSYEEMFPLDVNFPKEFDLYLLDHKHDIGFTCDFLRDVKEEGSLFLVGVYGIILLGMQHYNEIREIQNGNCCLSPAYYFERNQVLSCAKGEAQIPYFFKDEVGSIGIGYSRTSASSLPCNEPILIGKLLD